MTRTTIRWALTALLVAGATMAQGDAELGTHTVQFDAPSGDGAPITLGFTGKVYDASGWWLDALDAERLDDAERFVTQVVATNRDGDLEAMLALWHPDERDTIRTSAEGGLFERNQGFFRTITGSALRTRVDYGDFRIFLVQHDSPQTESGSTVNVYPLRRVDGRYYMTNALQDDFAFRYLVQVYRGRLIAQPSER